MYTVYTCPEILMHIVYIYTFWNICENTNEHNYLSRNLFKIFLYEKLNPSMYILIDNVFKQKTKHNNFKILNVTLKLK